jgi:hypothetical protein
VVELHARFDGAEFRRLQAAAVGESTFTGGVLRGEITIPKRVFDQLTARKRAWPIPWTIEDSLTTWLVPDRLLLYAQFAEPNDKWDVRLRIDGEPVEMRKAYTAVRVVPSTFVGFYADVSRLEPDRPHRFELEVPAVRPGQFRGLFFENVEHPDKGSPSRRSDLGQASSGPVRTLSVEPQRSRRTAAALGTACQRPESLEIEGGRGI